MARGCPSIQMSTCAGSTCDGFDRYRPARAKTRAPSTRTDAHPEDPTTTRVAGDAPDRSRTFDPSHESASPDAQKCSGSGTPNVAAAAVIDGRKSRYGRVEIGSTNDPSLAPWLGTSPLSAS